jgi:hypothetical protein
MILAKAIPAAPAEMHLERNSVDPFYCFWSLITPVPKYVKHYAGHRCYCRNSAFAKCHPAMLQPFMAVMTGVDITLI